MNECSWLDHNKLVVCTHIIPETSILDVPISHVFLLFMAFLPTYLQLCEESEKDLYVLIC